MNEDDGLEFSVDPYDMLQEHDLNIQRLIKANNNFGQWVEQMAKHQEQMAHQLNEQEKRLRVTEKRLRATERLVKTLVEIK